MSLLEPTDPDDIAGKLNYACQLGHTAFVERVVKEHNVTNMNMTDQYGSHPLYNAALKNDNPRLLEFLVNKGASIDMKNSEGESALFISAFNGHIECVKFLIGKGAKHSEPNGYYGDTPLHVCVRNNHHDCLLVLIEAGANVNAQNNAGETPLFLACKLDKRLECAYTLLMRGANKHLSSDGKDCLYIASEKKHKEIVQLLRADGPSELLRIKQSFGHRKSDPIPVTRKSSWEERSFREELERLGITEEEAARRPHPMPQPQRRIKKVDPTKPRPLFDSDEDDDEREERLRRENPPVAPQQVSYKDPEGTTYNPTGAAHEMDIQKAKAAFKDHPPTHTYKKAPPPGFIDHTKEESSKTGFAEGAAAAAKGAVSGGGSRAYSSSTAAKRSSSKGRSGSQGRGTRMK